MEDDFVPERYLGIWKKEGMSDWSAVLTAVTTQPEFYRPGEGAPRTSYSVRLDRGMVNMMSGEFFWAHGVHLSFCRGTREEAVLEAAATIDQMIAHLRVIAAGLRGDPDTERE